ncbi:MAG: substrate-binding domain-containing protein [Ruminococcus sp.]|nr:substrate-binding domain-containing protein [Ruminococcus sp.]
MKNKTANPLPLVIIGIAAVIVLAVALRSLIVYMKGKDFVEDKTGRSSNINVMLTRPDDWHIIQSGKISLSKEDFSWIDGSTATIPITAELARQFCNASDDEVESFVDHNTTHYAYEYLLYDQARYTVHGSLSKYKDKDLIFVTEPSEDEIKIAQHEGKTMDVTPVALDGFVFITHKDNPVDSLTVEQIQDIYSGKITNWKEVGGNDAEIIPYQRERNSGSQTAMEQLVMKDVRLMEPKEAYFEVVGMGELIEKIAEYENKDNSIGYTYYYYLNNLYKSDDIKVLKVDGIAPDNAHLADRSYPFTTAYYAVMAEGQEGKPKELRDYLLTDEGQQIIELAGYCPLNGE